MDTQHTQPAAPSGYHSVQPYLIFKDTRQAIDFYVGIFGATERMCMKDDVTGGIMHAELLLGDSCIMLADENPTYEAYSPAHYGGSPITLMLYVADCDATYHRALAAGAASKREPADQAYGDRSAGVIDPFGYSWYLATHVRDVSQEEMSRTMNASIESAASAATPATPAQATPA